MGEHIRQRRITELLRPLLEWWLNACRKMVAFVGADQFIYWEQYNPRLCVSPDVYVVPGVDPRTEVGTWKVWVDGLVPSVAIEVVSDDWEKDYYQAPAKYDELGVEELLIFDPSFDTHPEGVRWQVYRRVRRRGLVRVDANDEDRVWSTKLRCWFRSVGRGPDLRLRIAEGKKGEKLVPTAEEREQAALARVARLERELAQLGTKARKR